LYMGRCSFRLPEDFLLKLSRLGEHTDTIIPRVLEAGGEVVLSKVQSNLSAAIGHNTKEESRSTGELARSLGLSPAKQKRDGSGWDVKVGFSEPRKDGGSNAKIANILEYGKHGQPPRPFLKPARTAARKPCTAAMVARLEEEIGKL
jgi:HK97 gp10 family phage protein